MIGLLKWAARILLRAELRQGEDHARALVEELDTALEEVVWTLRGMVPTSTYAESPAARAEQPCREVMAAELAYLLKALQVEWIQLALIRSAALRLRSRLPRLYTGQPSANALCIPSEDLQELLQSLEVIPTEEVIETPLLAARKEIAALSEEVQHLVREREGRSSPPPWPELAQAALTAAHAALDAADIARDGDLAARICDLAARRDSLRAELMHETTAAEGT